MEDLIEQDVNCLDVPSHIIYWFIYDSIVVGDLKDEKTIHQKEREDVNLG